MSQIAAEFHDLVASRRLDAVQQMVELGSAKAVDKLHPLLIDPDRQVLLATIAALEQLAPSCDGRTLEDLRRSVVPLSTSKVPAVRSGASRLLKVIDRSRS